MRDQTLTLFCPSTRYELCSNLEGTLSFSSTGLPVTVASDPARGASGRALSVTLDPGYGLAQGVGGVPPSPLGGELTLTGTPPVAALPGIATRQFLAATHDPRAVITDIHASYFGIEVNDRSLTPDAGARLGATRFEDWLRQPARAR